MRNPPRAKALAGELVMRCLVAYWTAILGHALSGMMTVCKTSLRQPEPQTSNADWLASSCYLGSGSCVCTMQE